MKFAAGLSFLVASVLVSAIPVGAQEMNQVNISDKLESQAQPLDQPLQTQQEVIATPEPPILVAKQLESVAAPSQDLIEQTILEANPEPGFNLESDVLPQLTSVEQSPQISIAQPPLTEPDSTIAVTTSVDEADAIVSQQLEIPPLQATEVLPRVPILPQQYAQSPANSQPSRRRIDASSGDPDVLLDIPNLSVEEITLDVENLRARVSLDARLANLLQLTAGADASIEKVKLTIRGVQADVLLKVRLDNVAQIIDRTLSTIDRNPQILTRLLQSVDSTVGTVGNVANTAVQPGGVVDRAVGTVGQTLNNVTQPNGLLSQTVNTLGQTVQQTVDSTGNIVEKTLDTTGRTLNSRSLGSVLNLPVISQSTNSAGQTIRRVRTSSGRVIELTLNSAGKLLNSRVLSQTGQ